MDTNGMNNVTKPKTASRRELRGFACGIAQMFSSSAQHYAWLAYRNMITEISIDLFALQIIPKVFDIERNRILAEYCRSNLLQNLIRLKPPAAATAATLTVQFGIQDYREDGNYGASIGVSVYTVVLTDDRGKNWIGKVRDQRVLVQD